MWFLVLLCYEPQTLAVPPFEHNFGFYRASRYYLQLFLGPGFTYNDPQGIAVAKLKEHDDPQTKKDDDELSVFAVNSGTGQIVYNVGLSAVKTYGSAKVFSQPKGIAVTEAGVVAVADFGNQRIVLLQYLKGNLTWTGEIAMPGRPYGVCFDSRGRIYATDYDHAKVRVYDPAGTPLLEFGTPGRAYGELHQPLGIAVIDAGDPQNYYQEEFIVVVDNEGRRVSRFSISGRILNASLSSEIGLVDAGYRYCAIDYYGNIYVTDEVNDQIHKFDRALVYVISEGRTGVEKGEFMAPRGIAIGRRYGQVFIAEREGGQYLWIAGDGFFVGAFPEVIGPNQPGSTVAIYLTEESRVNIVVRNQQGEKVRDLVTRLRRTPGEFLVVWDGLDDKGVFVPPGTYDIDAELQATHGHGRRIKRTIKGKVTCSAY